MSEFHHCKQDFVHQIRRSDLPSNALNASSPHQKVYIRFRFKATSLNGYVPRHPDHELDLDPVPSFDDVHSKSTDRETCFSSFLHADAREDHISSMLNELNMSPACKSFIMYDIVKEIDKAVSGSIDMSNKPIGIDIDILHVTWVLVEEEELVDVSEYEIAHETNFLPASKTAIERLEKITKKTEDFHDRDCAICMEEVNYKKDEVILKMPCSHCFHGGCITTWLSLSHVSGLRKKKMEKHGSGAPNRNINDTDHVLLPPKQNWYRSGAFLD